MIQVCTLLVSWLRDQHVICAFMLYLCADSEGDENPYRDNLADSFEATHSTKTPTTQSGEYLRHSILLFMYM